VNPDSAGQEVLAELADRIRSSAWDLAAEVVELGLRDESVPSFGRLGRLGQVGDLPTFVSALAGELEEPQPERLRQGGALAVVVREHARSREGLGFSPREIVTEFLLLRRALWNFVSERAEELALPNVLVAEERLNDAVDRLVTECVVAYFDRATSELAHKARHDPLTELLNHEAFPEEVDLEVERARRYEVGLTLAFIDLDRFKAINDTLGHLEGDRALRRMAQLLREIRRGSDLAGRLGGDEFAVLLVQTEADAGGHFLARLQDRVDELVQSGELPEGFGFSGGLAHFPSDGDNAEALFRAADRRLYAVKRER
jgi:diguanylate cyclase (GGDEF)-like protein